jgi:ethanolamine permease
MEPGRRDPSALKKPLHVLDIWALGVGIVVCGQYFGWNAGLQGGGPAGMLLASLIICLLFLAWVLTLTELAVAMPQAGGPLEYGLRAGGPWLGFLMAWSMLLECLFGMIATALATAWYVAFLCDPAEPDSSIVVWAGLGTVAAFLILQAWGVREQSRALILMTYAALGGLVVYWLVAGQNFAWERAWPPGNLLAGKGWKAVPDAAPYALWWLIIIEGVALAAEETREPHRSIPRGFVWAMLTVTLMVLLTLGLTAGAVDWRGVTGDYPLAKVVQEVTGGQPGWLVPLFGTIAIFGLIASYHGLLFSTSRQVFALGRAGYLPGWLGAIHPTRGTPLPALLACSLVAAGFVIASVWFREAILVAILVAGLASLVGYLLAMVSLLRLRRLEPGLFGAYQAPLGRLLPVTVILLSGSVILVYPAIDQGGKVLLLGLALYGLGLGYFFFRRRGIGVSLQPTPVLSTRGREPPGTRPARPLLDGIAGVSLLLALLAVGWIGLTAYQPTWLRLASEEVEIRVCLILIGSALALTCWVAIAHTWRRGTSGQQGKGD